MQGKPKEQTEFSEERLVRKEVVLNAEEVLEAAEVDATQETVNNYKGIRSRVLHQHKPQKHDVREKYNVRDGFIREHFARFSVEPNDHAALWLLHLRKDEFINADEKVFKDVPDDDEKRWKSISEARGYAPVHQSTINELTPSN